MKTRHKPDTKRSNGIGPVTFVQVLFSNENYMATNPYCRPDSLARFCDFSKLKLVWATAFNKTFISESESCDWAELFLKGTVTLSLQCVAFQMNVGSPFNPPSY